MVESGRFDIIGHFDLPKKFGYYPSSMEKIGKMVKNIFKVAAKNKMAIEINTAGLRKPVKEMYPSLEILKMANEAGVLLTLGSDSHSPNEIAANFAEAVQLAKSAGYDKICSFNQRKPAPVPLG
jgi:histidinol-phosphatase (PHP family)